MTTPESAGTSKSFEEWWADQSKDYLFPQREKDIARVAWTMAIASVVKPTPYVALVEKINELSEDVETLRHSYQVYEKQAWEAREALQRANASFATQADENDRTVGKLRDTLKKAHDLLDWKAEHAASAVMAKIAEKEAFQITEEDQDVLERFVNDQESAPQMGWPRTVDAIKRILSQATEGNK